MPMNRPSLIFHPGYRSTALYSDLIHGTPVSNVAVAADTIYFFPVTLRRDAAVKGLYVRVGAAVPATNVKMALYDNAGGVEGNKNLISACPSAGNMNDTAGNTIACDLASVARLAPGPYWAAALFNGLAQPQTHATTAPSMMGLANQLGAPNAGAVFAVTTGATRLTMARAYTDGFPSIAVMTIAQSNVFPLMGWYHE